MRILLQLPDPELRDLATFAVEASGQAIVLPIATLTELRHQLMSEEHFDAVVVGPKTDTDVTATNEALKEMEDCPPVIWVVENPLVKTPVNEILPVIAILARFELPEGLVKVLQDKFTERYNFQSDQAFCRVPTDLLLKIVPLKSDVFLRLSETKFVRLFRGGRTFGQVDLDRWKGKKKIQYLYVEKKHVLDFVSQLRLNLEATLKKAKAGDETLMTTVTEIQDLVYELMNRLGFTDEVRGVAEDNIQLALTAIGESTGLAYIFNSSHMRTNNYISAHSVLLSEIACSLSALMQWPSQTTFEKLVMASLFHDYVFQNPENAKIRTKLEIEDIRGLGDAGLAAEVLNHPKDAAALIRRFREVPGDVDVIALQHHERPDGTGFPDGLRSHQIAPLSALFIVAHDIVDELVKKGEAFDLPAFLKDNELNYQNSPFRKVWKALGGVGDDI